MEILITIAVITFIVFTFLIAWLLSDILIELRYKNKLMNEQNEILKNRTGVRPSIEPEYLKNIY